MGRSRPKPVMPVTEAAPFRDQPDYERGHVSVSKPQAGGTP